MSFFTISNGKIETLDGKSSGLQDSFSKGLSSIWDFEDQSYKKPYSIEKDVEAAGGTVGAIKQTRHYPFVNFRRRWQGWADRTTFHGINIVFNKNARILRRIFWLGLILFMLYSLCIGFLTQFNRFLAYKTLNQQTIFFLEKLQFPSVSICNLNRINIDAVNDDRDRQIIQKLFTYDSNSTTFLEYPGLEYTKNVSLRKLFLNSAMTVEDMFKACNFDRHYYQNCSDIVDERIIETYLCHTVNPGSLNKSLETSIVGSTYGLTLVLWTNQDKYFLSDSASAGFKVLVHDTDDEPDIEQALVVGPGFTHYLSIRKHEYYYQKHPVKAFGDRECLDTTADSFKNPLKYSFKYSYNACHQECWNDYVFEICGCIGFTDIGDQVECDPFQLIECYNEAFVTFPANRCTCAIPCHMTTYETKLSSAYFPNTKYFEELNNSKQVNLPEPHDIKSIRENALILSVYYDSKVVTRHEQVLEFNREDLFSSIGGFLGLCIGASLITLIEIVENIFISIGQCCIPTR